MDHVHKRYAYNGDQLYQDAMELKGLHGMDVVTKSIQLGHHWAPIYTAMAAVEADKGVAGDYSLIMLGLAKHYGNNMDSCASALASRFGAEADVAGGGVGMFARVIGDYVKQHGGSMDSCGSALASAFAAAAAAAGGGVGAFAAAAAEHVAENGGAMDSCGSALASRFGEIGRAHV